jgi:very-short-patch-repair endonuclease
LSTENDSQKLLAKLEAQRKLLLDLGARNKLINFKHSGPNTRSKKQNYLRIVDEVPELILEKLRQESRFQLVAKPEKATYSFDLKLLADLPALGSQHSDELIQVIEEEPIFTLSCEKMRSENILGLQEKGINILNIAIGFVHWHEKKGTRAIEERYSPLLLLPVQISRERSPNGYLYFVNGGDDDVSINVSLWRKLREDEGLTLPELPLDEDGQPLLTEFFKNIRSLIEERNKDKPDQPWEIKNWATLGLFSFVNISIYNDLDISRWEENPLEAKNFLRYFIEGTPANDLAKIGTLSSSQDNDESTLPAEKIPKLIADADTTQYAVIRKAMEGHSLVVQGPPGTGKSQTITNMIACLVDSGKRVLFAADKLAALEVVKNRLEEKGLSEFCFEVHNASSSKTMLHQGIKNRIELKVDDFSLDEYSASLNQLKSLRAELNAHSELINKPHSTSFGQASIHDAIWQGVSNRLATETPLQESALKQAQEIEIDVVGNNILERASEELERLTEQLRNLQQKGIESILEVAGLPGTESESVNLFSELLRFKADYDKLIDGLDHNGFNVNYLSKPNKCFLHEQELLLERFKNTFKVSGNVPIDETFGTGLSEILRLVKIRESQQEHIPDWSKPLLNDSKKFTQLEDCLASIGRLINEENEIDSLSKFLEQLKQAFAFSRNAARNLSINHKPLVNKISYGEVVACVNFLRKETGITPLIATEILSNSKSAEDISRCYKTLEQIKRNSNLALEIQNEGMTPSRLVEIGSSRFKNAAEAIRVAGPLGCILSKDVRNAKSVWRLCCEIGSKRPSLPQLAKIYVTCAEYIERLLKEQQLQDEVISLNTLRDLSSEFRLVNRAESMLLELYDSLEDPSSTAAILVALASLSDELAAPQLACLSKLNLEETERLSGTSSASVSSKVGLLGEGARDAILSANPYDLSLLARDIDGYKSSTLELSQFLDSSNLFSEEGLEFSISSNELEALLSTYNSIQFSLLPRSISSELSSRGIDASVDVITQLSHLFVLRDILEEKSTKKPIKAFIETNQVQTFLESQSTFILLDRLLECISEAAPHQSDILEYSRIIASLNQKGLTKGVTTLIKISLESGISPKRLLLSAIAGNQSKEIELETQISAISGSSTNSLRKLFCDADQEFISNSSKALAASLSIKTDECLIDGNSKGSPKTFTESPLLIHELKKQRRHLPTRLLINQAFESLSRLMPCWMMSPASAAELLPKRPDLFDVLIIDEASQMKPEQAFSLIARSKQLIIVGDRNQLPPTNFFQKRNEIDDDDLDVEIEDNESILELADKVLSKNGCSLGWHYRSKHQSLIRFSNYHFYENSLTVFASNKVGSAVSLVQVDRPLYSAGVNLPEVEQTIAALRRQVAEDPTKSILVATMNEAQTSELKLALDREIQNDPLLENFASLHQSTLDELVVKNLENVQGDERDVVIVSTVYGPGADGRVMQNFGPINKASGWRRLNVLLTRAKHRVIIVTSLTAADITISANSSRGVRALREYIEYAHSGNLTDDLRRSSGSIESPFEESVRNALVGLGHKVDLQVGVASYRIDMAIIDPRDSSRYLLAIECDGASYHSSFSARSRDRLRQQVLEGLGWEIYRVWSTDWFRDPKRELHLLHEKITSMSI